MTNPLTENLNVERLNVIAEWLDRGGEGYEHLDIVGFNMAWFELKGKSKSDHCGTVHCIGGFANKLWGETWNTEDSARVVLGLTHDQAEELFFAMSQECEEFDLRHISSDWAARCIRHLIKTGEVNWLGTRATPATID